MDIYEFIRRGWESIADDRERRHFGMRCSVELKEVGDRTETTVFHVGRGGAFNVWKQATFDSRDEALAFAACEAIRIAVDRHNWCGLSASAIDAEYWDSVERKFDRSRPTTVAVASSRPDSGLLRYAATRFEREWHAVETKPFETSAASVFPSLAGTEFVTAASLAAQIDRRIPRSEQPQFIICAFVDVLLDQTLHAHFPAVHAEYSTRRSIPKLGRSGMGPHFANPGEALTACTANGLVTRDELIRWFPPAVDLVWSRLAAMSEQVPELKPQAVFDALHTDPDVGRGELSAVFLTCLRAANARESVKSSR